MLADEAPGKSLDTSPSQSGWQAERGVNGLRQTPLAPLNRSLLAGVVVSLKRHLTGPTAL